MAQNLVDRILALHEAERRLRTLTPGTDAWLDARQAAVQARTEYWDARRLAWDVTHPALARSRSERRPLEVA